MLKTITSWYHGPATSVAVPEKKATLADREPYQFPPMKLGTSSQMTMGLRRLVQDDWLTIDDNYMVEHDLRASQLADKRPSVLQCRPGSETACQEVLTLVSTFLLARYPKMFRTSGVGNGKHIHNLKTGEMFPLVNNPQPLETAARLAMEDFNVLIKDPESGQYRLQASATLFPAGWKLEERIGWTISELHNPVPQWKAKLGHSVGRYLDRLSPSTAMERHTLFVQTNAHLFQDDALCPSATPANSNGGEEKMLRPSDVHFRRERQTFRRLPQSQAVLFSVHTFIRPVTQLGDDELAAFIQTAEGWNDDLANYKGRAEWLPTVIEYQKRREEDRLSQQA